MSDRDSGWFGGNTRRTLLRWGAGAVLVVGLAGAGLIVAVRSMLDAQALERRLNAAVARATDGEYRVRVDTVQWGFWARSLQMRGVTLHPRSQEGERTDDPSSASRGARLSIPTLHLRGIDPWALLWRRVLRLNEVVVRRPHAALPTGTDPARSPDPSAAGASDTIGAGGTLTDVRIEQLQVRDGTLTRRSVDAAPRDSVWGVSLRLHRLSLDSARTQPPTSYALRRFIGGRVAGYRRLVPGTPYRVRLGASHVSRRDSSLRLTDLRFGPTVSDEAFVQHYEYRVNRYRTTAAEVAVAGMDLQGFIEEGALHADRVRINDLSLDVYRDNHRPEDPDDPPPPMPQDVDDRLDRFLRVDTLRLRDSRIRYTKRPEDHPRPGSIAFEDLWASAYNLTTDPQRMTPSTPAVVEARTRVNGAGRLRATFRIPLRAPHLNLSFRGRLGPMDAQAFNDPFVPLGGVRIEHGEVDSLWFQADVERGTATGSVGAVYRDLEIETLDKETGQRGLRERLKTTVAGLALRNTNHPSEGPLHRGRIEHTRASEDSFFKFLWHAVRDGIYSLVGIDRLPG